jgi:hypothetical protein
MSVTGFTSIRVKALQRTSLKQRGITRWRQTRVMLVDSTVMGFAS